MQHGDYSSAERIIRARLKEKPQDGDALGILAVVLDQEKNYSEADESYRRAMALEPSDPSLSNNFGNHLLATGKAAEARRAFLKVVSLDPSNANALVQLARLSLQNKAALEAFHYLQRIPGSARNRPDALVLQMQAEYLIGRSAEADALLNRLSSAAGSDAVQTYALGLALASALQYEKAETFFSKSLEVRPADFDATYNLGLAAAHAGHNDQALSALKAALAQRPDNVNVLFDLSAVNVALGNKEAALPLLVKASNLAPSRSDVLELEARTAAGLGYFEDAAHAWDEYLKLVPSDTTAARERAFAQTATGENMQQSLAVLHSFVDKHPGDAAGHYELGIAETTNDPSQALEQLSKAISLKPDLSAAHLARGLLLNREGETESALADFQLAAKTDPNNGTVLDRLGETYLALDRSTEALPVLRKAAQLQPSNPGVLLHLGRALSKQGQREEAESVFEQCRNLGPNRTSLPHPAGLVDFLSLSPGEQRARYVAGVERTVRSNPGNFDAQVRYLQILIEEHRFSDATLAIDTMAASKPPLAIVAEAVRLLLSSGQYLLAQRLLRQPDQSPELMLDNAIVQFHVSGPEAGNLSLGRIPPKNRDGDFYLAQALVLEATNRSADADSSLELALRLNPKREDLLLHCGLILLKDGRNRQANALLGKAIESDRDSPSLLLLQAIALELSGSHLDADKQFKHLENRWPEWYQVWIANALALNSRQQHDSAASMLEIARALGAPLGLASLENTLSQTVETLVIAK